MTDPAPDSFGAHVRRVRVAHGLTQEQLAERSKLHIDTIKGLERNAFEPSLRTLRKLAKGLGGLSLSLLFHGYEQGEHRDARQ
jgi:transcriptional regulator with XRE-family HTH domain